MVRTQLTDREDEVLQLVITGLSNEEIAVRLGISRRTVEAHMRTMFRKTGVARRTQLGGLWRDGELVAEPAAADPAGPASSSPHPDLADCQRRLQVYAAAVHELADRQCPLFTERVDITVTVGERDGQDTILERRWTRPRPYLIYR